MRKRKPTGHKFPSLGPDFDLRSVSGDLREFDLIDQVKTRSARIMKRLHRKSCFDLWIRFQYPRIPLDVADWISVTASESVARSLRSLKVDCVRRFMVSGRITKSELFTFYAFAKSVTLFAAHEAHRKDGAIRFITNQDFLESVSDGQRPIRLAEATTEDVDLVGIYSSSLRHVRETEDWKTALALKLRLSGSTYAEIGKQVGSNRNSAPKLVAIACQAIGSYLEGIIPPDLMASFIEAEAKRNPKFKTPGLDGLIACEPGQRMSEIVIAHRYRTRRRRSRLIKN